jgi:hypothetical protein
MIFFVGLISGIAASLGYAGLAKRLFSDPDRLPWISEYYVRSIWLELAGFYDLSATPPFTENDARAEIVIVGGGLTGLSSAYHLKKRFPDKRASSYSKLHVADTGPAAETAVSCRILITP